MPGKKYIQVKLPIPYAIMEPYCTKFIPLLIRFELDLGRLQWFKSAYFYAKYINKSPIADIKLIIGCNDKKNAENIDVFMT